MSVKPGKALTRLSAANTTISLNISLLWGASFLIINSWYLEIRFRLLSISLATVSLLGGKNGDVDPLNSF
jgi:hypothetical protein